MTLKELRKKCLEEDHELAGYYNSGELFVNNKDGETLYNKSIEWDTALEICNELGINLEEV